MATQYFALNVTTPSLAAPPVSPHGYAISIPTGGPLDVAAAYAALGPNFPVNPNDLIVCVQATALNTVKAVGTLVYNTATNPPFPPVGT